MPRVKATRGMLGASVGMQADPVVSRVQPAALAGRPTQITLGSGSGGPADGSSGPQAIKLPFLYITVASSVYSPASGQHLTICVCGVYVAMWNPFMSDTYTAATHEVP